MKKIIQIYKLLLPYLVISPKIRRASFLTLILIGFDIAVTTYFPYIWKNIVATPIQSVQTSWFIMTTLTLFITWMLKKTLPSLREIIFFKVTNEAIKDIRLRTIIKTHQVSWLNLEKYHLQEIISATARISKSIRQFMRVSFISIFPSFAKLISLSMALIHSDSLCFGIIMSSYLSLIVSAFGLKYYLNIKNKAWHLTDNISVVMAESLQHTAFVRFNLQEEQGRLNQLFDLEALAWDQHNRFLYGLNILKDIIFYVGTCGVFCILAVRYSKGTLSLDTLVLIYGLIASMYSPLKEILRNMTGFFGGIIDLNKTLSLLNLPSEEKPIVLNNAPQQTIYLKNVSFGYPEGPKLFDNVNLTIQPGDKIGIFGPSGSGKSTLCQMIAGLLSPTTGECLYGHDRIYDIEPTSLGNIIYYIPQGERYKTLDTQVANHNFNLKKQTLSGGEYQRYLLKKALDKKPSIIILDETTNALDRKAVDELLNVVIQSVSTVIMVTHRQTTLKKMDHIFQLNHGQLEKIHTNLIKT